MNLTPKKAYVIDKEVKEEDKHNFVGVARRKKGLKLFSLNTKTMELKELEIVKVEAFNINAKREQSANRTTIPAHCIPFQALNRKNAIRKVNRYIETGKLFNL